MGLNETPSSERTHIGFFGRRNAGKSSLVNAVTGQDLVIVSDVKGTTTDPVHKSMELLPLGPVLIIDTPGIDDEGALGELRVKKARQVLDKTDVAVLVVDAPEGKKEADTALIALFEERDVPYIVAWNKSDLLDDSSAPPETERDIAVSARNNTNIGALKEKIARAVRSPEPTARLVGDLLCGGDTVILVVPIDKAAPKGRLILPQQQTIRDILESDAAALVVKEHELRGLFDELRRPPRLVITDSQVFAKVAADTPPEIPLTSFSILFARYRGFLRQALRGARMIDELQDGDTVLVAEGCTHHRQCDDIGTVKIPRWIRNRTGRKLTFTFTSGVEFPCDLSPFRLVIHCGSCMVNERETRSRQRGAERQAVPFTNYGVAIAYMQGILSRAVALFPDAAAELAGQ